MSEPVSYPIPWRLIASLVPHLRQRTRADFDALTAAVVDRMCPPPVWRGLERLPADPRFLLAANHYQRPGLWIAHAASALTQGIVHRYGPLAGTPSIRWVVTANWPPWRVGPWRFASPGDRLLPRVAGVLSCFPVAFASANPIYTARSLRRLLKCAPDQQRPIGLFPEGAAGTAGRLTDPLPGVDRLIARLAHAGLACVPAAVSEAGGRLVVTFGDVIPPEQLTAASGAARLTMSRVASLLA